eukprot:GILJ01007167.1.p1 GENE.GILJ01007167.1~~GILJ01007167.1.p1  ORF type:complete len:222 (-),score=29.26 GILJ01007167.1:167-832(-)
MLLKMSAPNTSFLLSLFLLIGIAQAVTYAPPTTCTAGNLGRYCSSSSSFVWCATANSAPLTQQCSGGTQCLCTFSSGNPCGANSNQVQCLTPPTPTPAPTNTMTSTTNTTAPPVVTPDVVLDANVSVGLINLTVADLEAHVDLDLDVVNGFVQLQAGVDVSIQEVTLIIEDVQAEAHLTVKLDNVAKIVARVMETVQRTPQILAALGDTVDAVGGVLGNVL